MALLSSIPIGVSFFGVLFRVQSLKSLFHCCNLNRIQVDNPTYSTTTGGFKRGQLTRHKNLLPIYLFISHEKRSLNSHAANFKMVFYCWIKKKFRIHTFLLWKVLIISKAICFMLYLWKCEPSNIDFVVNILWFPPYLQIFYVLNHTLREKG